MIEEAEIVVTGAQDAMIVGDGTQTQDAMITVTGAQDAMIAPN